VNRFLILEFLVVERCRNDSSHYLPFYAGMAKDAGARVSWLAYGCDYDMAKWGYYVDLPEADLATLAREVRRCKPTHILSSEYLSERTFQVLVENAPKALYLSTRKFMEGGQGRPLTAGPETPKVNERPNMIGMWKAQSLDTPYLPYPWLAPKRKPRSPRDAPMTMTDLRPDYGARIMNKLGERLRSFVRIIGGHHCSSTVPLAGNPFMKGIDLSRYPSPYGCTYCSVTGLGNRNVVFPRDPVATAVRQLKQVIASAGTRGRNATEYDIYNTQVFLQVERFFGELLKARFPPGAFHFSPRLDDFLNMWEELNRVMPRLAAAGHSLHILRMGIENFSPAEQGRFNKGISMAQAVEGFYKIKDLKTRYPKNFFVIGFGFILFTPWTSLEDVQLNLTVARLIGFPVCGHMLTSAIQMDYNVPMIHAARRDGLLLDDPDDAAMLYDAWRNRYYRENPHWFRFQDPAVAVLFQTLVRIVAHMDRSVFGSYFPKSDAASRRAVEFFESLPKGERDYIDVAEILVEAARGLKPGDGPARLLRRARAVNASPVWRNRLRAGRMHWWLDRPAADLLSRPKASAFVKDQPEGAAAPPAAPKARTPLGELLSRSLPALLKVLVRLDTLPASPLPGCALQTVSEDDKGGYCVLCTWRDGDGELVVRIAPADQGEEQGLCRSRRLRLSYLGTDSLSPERLRGLRQLCALLERCLPAAAAAGR
jgi:hypothetical protein